MLNTILDNIVLIALFTAAVQGLRTLVVVNQQKAADAYETSLVARLAELNAEYEALLAGPFNPDLNDN